MKVFVCDRFDSKRDFNKDIEIRKGIVEKIKGKFGIDAELANFDSTCRNVMQTSDIFINKNTRILAISIELDLLSECSIVYFARGWENDFRCSVIHDIAKNCGLAIIYE